MQMTWSLMVRRMPRQPPSTLITPLVIRLEHCVLFFLGGCFSPVAICPKVHRRSSIEESWRASERGDVLRGVLKQSRPPVSSMTLRTRLPPIIVLKPLAPQTEDKTTCTTETTTVDWQDDLSTPTHRPFLNYYYWGPVEGTSGTFGSKEHLYWPSAPRLWSSDEQRSTMTRMRTTPFFKAEGRTKVETLQWNHINDDAHIWTLWY